MGFNEEGAAGVADADGGDVDGAEGKGRGALLVREEEGGLAVRELEPEVAEGLGARCDAPGSQGVRGEAGLEPLGEGIRRGEGEGGGRAAHRQGFDEATVAAEANKWVEGMRGFE